MPDDSRDTERELIQQGAPLINAIGMNTAERRAALNKAVKGQLELVEAELKWYLHNDHDQMPHEWGSMDTYDDMRNSLRLAAALMDTLLDPFVDDQEAIDQARRAFAYEGSICAVHDDVLLALFGTTDDDEVWAAVEAIQNEQS
jgi:hypothetical protein